MQASLSITECSRWAWGSTAWYIGVMMMAMINLTLARMTVAHITMIRVEKDGVLE